MTPRVPFLDLGAATASSRPSSAAAIARVVASGWYVLGPEVERFERRSRPPSAPATPSASATASTRCG